MIYCFIVSNNPTYINQLTEYIEKAFGIILLGIDSNIDSSLNKIRTFYTKPDYIFLDSEYTKSNYNRLCSILRESSKIISVSASKEAAFSAFEIGAHDFMLLPSTYNKFLDTISKGNNHNYNVQSRNYFYVKLETKCKLLRIEFQKLFYLEALHNYVKLFTESGTFITYASLKTMEDSLPRCNFLRVHRSYIVNLGHVLKVDSNLLHLTDGKIVPIGSKFQDAFFYAIRDHII